MTKPDPSHEIAVYSALAAAGDTGLPLASLARLVGAKRAGELLTVMGQRYDFEQSNGRFYLRDA
jgi:hypothetical protein